MTNVLSPPTWKSVYTLSELQERYQALRARKLNINLTRGKPSPEQLDLVAPMLAWSALNDHFAADGTDCRNYGGDIAGLPEARRIFADLLKVPEKQVVVAGNSSLALMHDVLTFLRLRGSPIEDGAWSGQRAPSFLCPVPGYDRHFAICEALGIKMLSVPMTDEGPDMEIVESLVRSDSSIGGMWCMPRYSNPTGVVYSASVVERLARMQTAAPDFHLFWDDAYMVHDHTDRPAEIPQIIHLSSEAGHPCRPFVFASTSKMTLAGSGLAAVAGSPASLKWWRSHVAVRTIGPDKLNQLRHVRFLKDAGGVRALMKQHQKIIKPKFDAVHDALSEALGNQEHVSWSKPRGGYFLDLQTPEGCARKVVNLAADIGVKLTPAGAAFPYGHDPEDRHIRIAPTFPQPDEIGTAATAISTCVLLAIAEKRELAA